MSLRSLARALSALAVTAALTLTAGLTPAAAQAAPIHYVALGDSYSSGVGAGSYDLSGCMRSQKSYAPLWAASHSATSFAFPACGGAVTEDVLDNQIASLKASTTMVTITIGGNDAGFIDVMLGCRFGSDASCARAVDTATEFARTELPGRLDETYAAIRAKAPNARLVVLGYPRLFELTNCGWLGMSLYKRTIINEAADELAEGTAERARAAGVTFVDTRPIFAGHGVCSSDPWIHGSTALIEMFHPNANGYRYGYLAALNTVTS